MKQEWLMITTDLIKQISQAKQYAGSALQSAKAAEFKSAAHNMFLAQEKIQSAKLIQADLLATDNMVSNSEDILMNTLLSVHSEDHLVTASAYLDLVSEFINVYKRLMTE
ncbi:PTS lactose/cellobiose transporter subunit IIA [Vagococcus vulneris]|uniref:PTS lactose/cellobiose transporter subunit IIA n=1 Tax=Vagococcus vulneris TaxID=1977869 RepID=A0A429ZXK9_9ENTE|nr:PTS lactose/cellobiose transporter subunit IIA [Vagococcus vulneris]RST98545.1 hypothetical protein CBF37_07150 [Vagococcus vulneris]